MKIVITGAAGRLGSNVCRILLESGEKFRAVDRVAVDESDYTVENINLHDEKACRELLSGVDALAHFANHANWDSTNPQQLYNENVTMNMNLFQAAADVGCHRIVFSSSVQVLDGQLPLKDRREHPNFLPYIPLDSEMPAIPKNSYALSKQAAESMLEYFSAVHGLTCAVIRFPLLIDSQMLKTAVENGGMVRRNCYDGFTYLPVYSAAEVAVQAMTAPINGYRNYFVASKDNLEQRPAREIIEQELSHLPCHKPMEEMDSLVDCTKVETELDWQQPKSLTESFEKYGSRKPAKPYA